MAELTAPMEIRPIWPAIASSHPPEEGRVSDVIPPGAATRALALGTSTLYEASKLPCAADPLIRAAWAGAAQSGAAHRAGARFAGQRVDGEHGQFHCRLLGRSVDVAAQAADVAGLVIDGGVRDVAALARRRFPVFTRGISVRGTIKASVISVGRPIRFTGVPVQTGDLVVADDDGVIVLRAAEVPRVLADSEARAAKEAEMMKKIEQGATTLELLGLGKWREWQ